MTKISNVTGLNKCIFNLKVKMSVLFHFLPVFCKGEITLKRYILFLKRLLIFLNKIQHNKFVRIGEKTRLNLYVPSFPSKAFYTACKKFMQFEDKMPCTTVLMSVTSACIYKCSHCYQRLDKGKDTDINILIRTAKKLQDMGIAFFNIEGGEPFLAYDRLKMLCASIDDRSEIWVNSTGYGITKERLIELKSLNVTTIMFSLHSHEPQNFNKFMGNDAAWDTLSAGIETCHEAGMAVAFNSCLMKEDFYNGNFEEIMNTAKDFKACILQLIKPKPSGAWLGKKDIGFDEKDIEHLRAKLNKYNLTPEYAEYPSIFAQIIEEDKTVFGCTAGGIDRFYINAKGDLQPCEFLNISFGNIAVDEFETIYANMRACFAWGGDCYLCEKYAAKIHRVFKENNFNSLPLPPDLSKNIYNSWSRGEKTDLYDRIENLR